MNSHKVRKLDELARDIPPSRDLWPGIAAAVEADKASRLGEAPVARRPRWMPVDRKSVV